MSPVSLGRFKINVQLWTVSTTVSCWVRHGFARVVALLYPQCKIDVRRSLVKTFTFRRFLRLFLVQIWHYFRCWLERWYLSNRSDPKPSAWHRSPTKILRFSEQEDGLFWFYKMATQSVNVSLDDIDLSRLRVSHSPCSVQNYHIQSAIHLLLYLVQNVVPCYPDTYLFTCLENSFPESKQRSWCQKMWVGKGVLKNYSLM